MESWRHRLFLIESYCEGMWGYKLSDRAKEYLLKAARRTSESKANRNEKTLILNCLLRLIPMLDENRVENENL